MTDSNKSVSMLQNELTRLTIDADIFIMITVVVSPWISLAVEQAALVTVTGHVVQPYITRARTVVTLAVHSSVSEDGGK